MHGARERERSRKRGEGGRVVKVSAARVREREERKVIALDGSPSWLPSCANRASHFWPGREEQSGLLRRCREMRHLRDLPVARIRLN